MEEKIAEGKKVNIIDVRERAELQVKKMPDVQHIPIGEISNRLSEIKKEEPYYIVCESGNRSGEVANYLEDRGYDAINIIDGMVGWEEQ